MKKNFTTKANAALLIIKEKISVVGICIMLLTIGLSPKVAYSMQDSTITLNLNNVTIKEVIEKIKEQSEYSFFVDSEDVDLNKVVSINMEDRSIKEVLAIIVEGEDFSYTITDNRIRISSAKAEPLKAVSAKAPQQKTSIMGTVTSITGEPLIGVTVVIKGTTKGTLTNLEGQYTINTPPKDAVLQFTYFGLISMEVSTLGKPVVNVVMKESAIQIDEVVVTALGIKRAEKALGYSVQKIGGDDLPAAKTIDVAASLTGKIAGLNIQNSTEFDESASIKLRGETPLLIVDGVPYGNLSLNDLASDDIEDITVLKGATASALYGSRGSSGAIMVTTKKGAGVDGVSVNISSNTMFHAGYLAFPETHSSYSRGYGSKYGSDYVWGDKLDIGRRAIQYDPATYEWTDQELTSRGKDNYKNFLELGFITNNNVSIAYTGKYGSVRSSLTYAYNKGQYPNQDLNKFTYFVGGNIKYKAFSLDAGITYNKRITSNDNGSGYSGSYIYDLVIWGSTDYDLREYKNYWIEGKEHVQQNWYDDSWYDNPYFKANEMVSSIDKDVVNAYFNTSYELAPWLKAIVRTGVDMYSKMNEWQNAKSANYGWDKDGYYGISRSSGYSVNTDAMLMADKTWGKFNANFLAGANMYYYSDDYLQGTTKGGLSVPGFYSLNSSAEPALVSNTLSRKQVNSLYSKLSLSWDDTYFVDLTGRNDWSSTLNADNRSYFYPSASASVVLSQIFELPEAWNFWKIRSSWTSTKSDAGVYANNNNYNITPNIWDGLTSASYPSSIIGGIVNPKNSEVFEVGTSARFLNNRLHFDFAYYNKVESDFIINGGISGTTGFNSVQINSGEERMRTGMEVTIGGVPIKTADFTWTINTNFSHDKYTYSKIDPKYSTKRDWVAPGLSWDWMQVYDWDRDPSGNIIHNGGIPVKQNFMSKVGNTSPDLVWGVTNSFRYKQFTLDVTIDGRVGGKSFSRTHQMLMNSGSGIDADTPERYDQVVNGNTSYVGTGVKVVSGSVERDSQGRILSDSRVFAANDVAVGYEAYTRTYHGSASAPSYQNILDETFFKVRNLSITYNIPDKIAKKANLKNAAISLTAQNLYLWAKDYKYADPDKGGDGSGFENLNSPSQRMIGVNLKLNF